MRQKYFLNLNTAKKKKINYLQTQRLKRPIHCFHFGCNNFISTRLRDILPVLNVEIFVLHSAAQISLWTKLFYNFETA